jgi:hypothetical protein
MTPYLEARAVYSRDIGPTTFDEDLAGNLLTGIVHSDDKCFLMAKKINSKANPSDIANPFSTFENPDCWLVWLYAGDMIRAFSFADTPLPLVAFARKNRLRFYHWDIILKKVSGIRKI